MVSTYEDDQQALSEDEMSENESVVESDEEDEEDDVEIYEGWYSWVANYFYLPVCPVSLIQGSTGNCGMSLLHQAAAY